MAGATGYTGLELIRLLLSHPQVSITRLYAHSHAGKKVSDVYPHLGHVFRSYRYDTIDQSTLTDIDVLFLALPHGESQRLFPMLSSLPFRIIDLSADFRLNTPERFENAYGTPHQLPDQLGRIPLGLPELYRDQLRDARYVACPGCYATAVMVGLAPLAWAGRIKDGQGVVIDAKSGVSGAGRVAKESNLFCEVHDTLSAYGTYTHRHVPEMEMVLGTKVLFSPHLVPMSRGILSSMYIPMTSDEGIAACYERYTTEPFITLQPGGNPSTAAVTGSNMVMIWWQWCPGVNQLVVFSALDNVIKGASGQAIQCLNVMMGWDETLGLPTVSRYY